VPGDAPSIDRAYVERLVSQAAEFPAGARWWLFAFEQAHDDHGRSDPRRSTFHVPDAYAAQVANRHPARFDWVASIHPYREDALQRLDAALAAGARAVKWLPSAMNIDLRDPRCRPFCERLASAGRPLIVHCGEEKAVPGAGRDELGNPLHVRHVLADGVRVVMAHCGSLGHAIDEDRPSRTLVPAFDLFARLMDEPAHGGRLLGDVSAVFQRNRTPEVWCTVLQR
jgi:mannonate dehydratase